MLTKIALLSLLATLVAGDHVTKDEKGAGFASAGFMLVKQEGYCGILGQVLGTDITDVTECFHLAKKAGATAFSMGRKYRMGICSVELLKFTCSEYNQWKDDEEEPICDWNLSDNGLFQSSRYYDWFAISPPFCDEGWVEIPGFKIGHSPPGGGSNLL